jgi:uncharacterized membrane protein
MTNPDPNTDILHLKPRWQPSSLAFLNGVKPIGLIVSRTPRGRTGSSNTPRRTSGFRSGSLLDRSFHVSIGLKGLHALLETIGGVVLLKVAPQTINRILLSVLSHDLSDDPHDFIAAYIRHAFEHFAAGGRHFASWYLLSHGAVKLVLVVALFKNKLWAYPSMIATLTAFVCYQTYRFALTHSLAMILLTIFDLVIIVLTWLEYVEQKSHRPSNLR